MVVYSNLWDDLSEVMPLNSILKLDVDYNDSLFEDSMVYVEIEEGVEISFPLFSERGLDKKFISEIGGKMMRK